MIPKNFGACGAEICHFVPWYYNSCLRSADPLLILSFTRRPPTPGSPIILLPPIHVRAREINLLVYHTYLNSSDMFLKFNSSSLFSQFPNLVVSTSQNNDSGIPGIWGSTIELSQNAQYAQYMDTQILCTVTLCFMLFWNILKGHDICEIMCIDFHGRKVTHHFIITTPLPVCIKSSLVVRMKVRLIFLHRCLAATRCVVPVNRATAATFPQQSNCS